MRTEYVCQDCGYVWSRAGINRKGAGTPKKKNPYIVPAVCVIGVLFLVFSAFSGKKEPANTETETVALVEKPADNETRSMPGTNNTEEETAADNVLENEVPVIRSLSFASTKDVTLKIGQTNTSDYLKVDLDKNYVFSPEEIQFVSDDPEIASIKFTTQKRTGDNISLYYEVEGKAEGETSIYAMTTDGDIISDPVKVIVKAPIEVESVTIEGDFDDLLIGESTTLTAVVEPKNAENAAVSWSSNDEEVLTVDSNGKVTAVGGGSAEITASTPNGKEDTCEIYVDASSRRMKVRVNYSRDDDNNIGHEWSHSFRINGEPVEKEMLISEGDTLKFYAEFTESDEKPDEGEVSKSYTVTEDDLQEGFDVEMEVYVTENGGRNSGKSAHYIVTFTFTTE